MTREEIIQAAIDCGLEPDYPLRGSKAAIIRQVVNSLANTAMFMAIIHGTEDPKFRESDARVQKFKRLVGATDPPLPRKI